MKYLTRKELEQKFEQVITKYGKPSNGEIFCFGHLISKVVEYLSCFDECHIIYENGVFNVSASVCIKAIYPSDYTFLGSVRAKNWFSKEQLRALHELAFGYQF